MTMKRTLLKTRRLHRPFFLTLFQNEQKGIALVFGLILVAGLLVVITTRLMNASAIIFSDDKGTVLGDCPQENDDPKIVRDRMTRMDSDLRCNESCTFQLVESLPCDMPYGPNSNTAKPLYQAWMELLNMTQESIYVASYYWTLTGKDIGVNDTSSKQGEEILKKFESLLLENISVFISTSMPSTSNNSTDLEILEGKGAHVRRINFGQLTHGVLHTKFWIVDRKHIFLGSANVDWRALTQVKEVGVVIHNCGCLADDLWKTFKTYWDLGEPNATIPSPWPGIYSTDINRNNPLKVQFNGISTKAYFSASPSSFCPGGRTYDLVAILDVICDAEEFVYVSIMEYFPTSRFRQPPRYWPPIDNALRSVLLSRKIHVRLLVSCWIHTDPSMLRYLESLSVLNDPRANITIEVKLFIVPVGNHTNIPFARLSHSKYMVTDKAAYIGTSNWSEEYFSTTAGVGLIAKQSSSDPQKRKLIMQEQLKSLFERDWNSKYAVSMDDLPGQKDCSWEDGFKSLRKS